MSKTAELDNKTDATPTSVNYVPPTTEEFLRHLRNHVRYSLAKDQSTLSSANTLQAVSLAVRDFMIDRMIETERRYAKADAKRLYYLSMEFLVGRSLGNNITNLELQGSVRDALDKIGVDLEDLRDEEVDAALGNGGLGRLAACFLDSLATLHMPGFGYGINYEYGLFKQQIENGYQIEQPDHWRADQNPWLIEHCDEAVNIPIYGRLEEGAGRDGRTRQQWVDCAHIVGVPSDMPVVGYGGRSVNWLRLYSARASAEFDIQKFNQGHYVESVESKIQVETISKVLYPSDAVEKGRELRLVQEYFFVSCALRDIMRRYLRTHATFDNFAKLVAVQMNDTHPALAVAELMRLLMDEQNLTWEESWRITHATLGFTNHTLLPEALEKWPEELFKKVLPRHLHIIYEINRIHLEAVAARWPGNTAKLQSLSIIEDAGQYRQVRMAHLAIVGSHKINGVAALHSELIKSQLVPDFYELMPEKFSNKTNGVTPRRWLLKANPQLADLLTETVGPEWITNLEVVRGIEEKVNDAGFRDRFRDIKRHNKTRFAKTIKETVGATIDPDSIFDVICKRMHEYKRQLLMAMRIIHDYLTITEDGKDPVAPRTYVFAGKAAPGYWAAKQIIKLITELGRIVAEDKRCRGRISVVFVPDYRVSAAERIIPAADISEQISTAGKEASGTGNMKFAMNGALTVCTWDGANIEIAEAVGLENIYVFGLRTEEIKVLRDNNNYNPWDYYNRCPEVRRVMDVFRDSQRLPFETGVDFQWIFNNLMNQGDPYCHLADLEPYIQASDLAAREYKNRETWTTKAILNVARVGRFSSDRTIQEYADDIWDLKSV